MPLQLTITSYQRLSPGQEITKILDRTPITIGRAAQSDWVLQDPERILSKHHCTVLYRDGAYWLTDFSVNGTFINDCEQQIGRHQTVEIKDGDRFTLGEYEIAVAFQFEGATLDGPVTDIMPSTENASFHAARLALTESPNKAHDAAWSNDSKLLFDEILAPRGVSPGPPSPAQSGVPNTFATTPSPDLSSPERINFEPPSLRARVTPQPETASALIPAAAEPIDKTPVPEALLIETLTPPEHVVPESAPDLLHAAPEPIILESLHTPPEPTPESLSSPAANPALTTTLSAPETTDTPIPPASPLIPEDWWMESSAAPTSAASSVQDAETGVSSKIHLETAAHRQSASPLNPALAVPDSPIVAPTSPPTPAPPPAPMPRTVAGDTAKLAQAFAQGAGLPVVKMNDEQLASLLRDLGAILRETVRGLMEILLARGDVKGEFRLDRTAIGPTQNNPLKTPPGRPPLTPEAAIALLLAGPKDAYMPPVQAVRESFNDIKAHQLAVMAGIQAALRHLLERFDPGNLESRLEQNVLDNLWPANRKAKYWDLFMAEYAAIAREAEDDFNKLFGEEFARAYQDHSRDQ